MANHISAKKRAIRNKKKALSNKSSVSRLRGELKKVELAIASGDAKAAEVALRDAQPKLYKSASQGLIEKNAAARKMSRLSAKIKAMKKSAK